MKYFTDEYIQKKKYLNCLEDFLPIKEDKIDTEEKIASLYQEKLKERLKKAEKDFNTPLKMKETREEIIATFKEDKYPKYDLYSKRVIGYLTLEEVLRSYDAKKEKLDEMFQNRGSFPRERQISLFQDMIQERISSNFPSLPYSVKRQADPLLLALGYLPQSIYDSLKEKLKQDKKYVLEMEEKEKQEFDSIKDSLPLVVREMKDKRFPPLVSILTEEKDLSFYFHFEGLRKMSSTGFSKLLFKNVKKIQGDVPFSKEFKREKSYPSFYEVLNREVEKNEEGILFSFLLKKEEAFYSLSVLFETLEYIENY